MNSLLSLVFLGMVVTGPWAAKTHPEQRKFELKAESESFWKLISHDAKLATLASGLGFTEGPVWDPSRRLLRWVEECGATVVHKRFGGLVPMFCPVVPVPPPSVWPRRTRAAATFVR